MNLTIRNILTVALVCATVSSFAQRKAVPIPSNPIPLEATDMTPIDQFGNAIGPTIQLHPEQSSRAQLMSLMFDFRGLTDDGVTTNYQIYNPSVFSGSLIFTDAVGTLLRYPWFVNDVDFKPGKAGKPVKSVRNSIVWAPGGGTLTTAFTFGANPGLYRPALDIWFVGKWSDGTDGFIWKDLLSGFRFTFGTAGTALAPNFYSLNVTFNELGGSSFPSPGGTTDGGYMVICRKVDGVGVVSDLTGTEVMEPGFRPVCSATDPVYPGTNLSDSSELCWLDESGDYTMAATEILDFDDPVNGRLQPTTAALHDVNQDPFTAVGNVIFSDLADPVGNYKASVEMDAVPVDALDQPIPASAQVLTMGVAPDGSVQVLHPRGLTNTLNRYILSFKRTHWLRANTGIIDFNALPAAPVFNLTLINGDVDEDNEVGPADFSILSGAFGTSNGDTGYVANADLDEDDEVGPSDFGILSASFGTSGDDDLTP